jgi:hypothetical protein
MFLFSKFFTGFVSGEITGVSFSFEISISGFSFF